MTNPPGIFCLEGAWSSSLADRRSVRHLLDCLSSVGVARTIHRDVHTKEELFFLLDKWTQKQYATYRVGWLAFHGAPGALSLGRAEVSLAEIGDRYAGLLSDKILYFASCSTMETDPTELEQFRRRVGARALCGYTREVDWLEAAAFELVLLDELGRSKRLDLMDRRIRSRYGSFAERLGFRTWTAQSVRSS